VAPQLASGELKTVLGAYEEPDLPVHVIHREGRHGSANVRSFVAASSILRSSDCERTRH